MHFCCTATGTRKHLGQWHIDRMRCTKVWITQKTSVIYYSNSIWPRYHTTRIQFRLQAQTVGRSVTIRPKCQRLTKLFSRCFRKSMWWKGSFPPNPRWVLCCSFCLGESINLHPDLVYARALQRGSLMCSTSPVMEALPRLSQISKTDAKFPLRARDTVAMALWCKVMFA